jgi:pimeloyl-ACP methyl ester carboxylesterase
MNNLILGVGVAIYAFWYGFSWSTVVTLVLSVVGMLVYSIVMNQEKMLYQTQIPGLPSKLEDSQYPAGYRSPADYGLSAYETVQLKTSDGETLNSLFVNAHRLVGDKYVPVYSSNIKTTEGSDSDEDIPEIVTAGARRLGARPSASEGVKTSHVPTILYLHENAGTLNLRMPNLFFLAAGLQANVFCVDYRGYGHSTGAPSEEGLILDAHAALAHLRARHDVDTSHIHVFGRSLGGAVTLALATEDAPGAAPPLRGVIVENSFLGISKLVDSIFPVLRWVKPLVLRLRWESEARAPKLDVPALLISGGADELVPAFHMETLYELIGSSVKCKVLIDAGGHNTTWIQGGRGIYLNYFRQYMRKTGGLDDSSAVSEKSLVLTTASVLSSLKELAAVEDAGQEMKELEDHILRTIETTMGMKIE